MNNEPPTPLQASFWLTSEEKGYILAIFAILLVGIVARYFYLKHETPRAYTPEGIEKTEPQSNLEYRGSWIANHANRTNYKTLDSYDS